MKNSFGNYLCQKITEVVNRDQLIAIIEKIEDEIVDICKDKHGTRAIQKIIECAKDQQLIDTITNLLKPHVQTLVEDINGNHVIYKLLVIFKDSGNELDSSLAGSS